MHALILIPRNPFLGLGRISVSHKTKLTQNDNNKMALKKMEWRWSHQTCIYVNRKYILTQFCTLIIPLILLNENQHENKNDKDKKLQKTEDNFITKWFLYQKW